MLTFRSTKHDFPYCGVQYTPKLQTVLRQTTSRAYCGPQYGKNRFLGNFGGYGPQYGPQYEKYPTDVVLIQLSASLFEFFVTCTCLLHLFSWLVSFFYLIVDLFFVCFLFYLVACSIWIGNGQREGAIQRGGLE